MKYFIFALFILFSGCLDIKISSETPKIEYFSINNYESKSIKKCNNIKNVGLLNIDSLEPFDSVDIMLFEAQSMQMQALQDKKWITTPQNMLTQFLLESSKNTCINLVQMPFGSVNITNALKIKINSLLIIKNKNNLNANLSLSYEVLDLSTHRIIKSANLNRSKEINNLEDFAKSFLELYSEAADSMLSF